MLSAGAGARAQQPTTAVSRQSSQLLPALFRDVDPEQRLSVLYLGPATSETVAFFSAYRSHLHIADLFSELPPPATTAEEDRPAFLRRHFTRALQLSADRRFDLCFFWDLFDYLDGAALTALLAVLRPYLHPATLAHGFCMHSPRSPAPPVCYGIQQADTLSIRSRPVRLPGYAPHNQKQLRDLLHCFRLERSVLLPDRRLELLLRAQLAPAG